MKEYLKPELEYVSFAFERIAGQFPGDDQGESDNDFGFPDFEDPANP